MEETTTPTLAELKKAAGEERYLLTQSGSLPRANLAYQRALEAEILRLRNREQAANGLPLLEEFRP